MKALLIDDERLARRELRRLLAAHPEIEIAGEAENATAALPLIAAHRPDLIFLDIQMPGASGFELLAQIPPPVPRIIFTTAHDAHALRAFEVNALDYLLKPIAPERLATALARLNAEPDPPATPLRESDRVFLRSDGRSWFVTLSDVRLLESVGNYTRVCFSTERVLIHRTLAALEARLPAAIFFRANRSQIVNLRAVEQVEDWFSGGLRLRIAGGERVEISRRRAAQFRQQASL